jgi:low affinity Fe/Cu permease
MKATLPTAVVGTSGSRQTRDFGQFAAATASWAGSTLAFIVALMIVAIWAATGPLFNFSDTWQLVINTGTSIITLLMVFLIQNTQNRDTKAIQIKLAELILALEKANDRIAAVEDVGPEELQEIHDDLKQRAHDTSTWPKKRSSRRRKAPTVARASSS